VNPVASTTTIKVETSVETTEVMIVVVIMIEVVALIVVEEVNHISIKEVSKDSSTSKTNTLIKITLRVS
jgi:hypothetical protein